MSARASCSSAHRCSWRTLRLNMGAPSLAIRSAGRHGSGTLISRKEVVELVGCMRELVDKMEHH
eukprot:4511859-Pyramimonas_sp.AAC.1